MADFAFATPVGHVHVSIMIDVETVGEDEHSPAKALDQSARRVELEDGGKV
jgi:hypothetical protein